MIDAVGVDRVVQAPQKFCPMPRHKIDARDLAFLQSLIGIERIAEQIGVPAQNFRLPQLSSRRSGAQLRQLMLHLGRRIGSRVDQG